MARKKSKGKIVFFTILILIAISAIFYFVNKYVELN